ncbi:hypothetical protein EJ04DRAFT_605046, partial [Polyplosphaeria fusca]
ANKVLRDDRQWKELQPSIRQLRGWTTRKNSLSRKPASIATVQLRHGPIASLLVVEARAQRRGDDRRSVRVFLGVVEFLAKRAIRILDLVEALELRLDILLALFLGVVAQLFARFLRVFFELLVDILARAFVQFALSSQVHVGKAVANARVFHCVRCIKIDAMIFVDSPEVGQVDVWVLLLEDLQLVFSNILVFTDVLCGVAYSHECINVHLFEILDEFLFLAAVVVDFVLNSTGSRSGRPSLVMLGYLGVVLGRGIEDSRSATVKALEKLVDRHPGCVDMMASGTDRLVVEKTNVLKSIAGSFGGNDTKCGDECRQEQRNAEERSGLH